MAPLTLTTCLPSSISSLLIMIPFAAAMVRIQAAAPTPAASLIMNGISPRPTNPPGSNGVPRELLRRAAGIEFPPPANWCGFVDGDYDNPLSCTNTRYTCIFSGLVAVGCCASLNGACSALNTACMDSTANWGPYKSDTSRLIWLEDADALEPPSTCCSSICFANFAFSSSPSLRYCASYVFPEGHRLFYCESTAYAVTSVGFLNDYYITAIGSTVGSIFTDRYTTSARRSVPASTTDSTSSPTTIPVRITTTPYRKRFGTGAIAGVGSGAGLLLLAAIAGIIFCLVKRKRNQATPPQLLPPPPTLENNAPMQQQGYMAPPFQNFSQPNAQYPTFSKDSKSPYEATRASTYGQPSTMSSPLLTHLTHGDPNNRASTVSPPLSHNPSVAGNMRPISSNLPITSETNIQRINSPDYYKQPTGTISEVDGMGPQPQIYEAAGAPVYAGGGAQEHGQGQQHQPGAFNIQTYAGQAQPLLPQVHEAPAQQEPKYVPYNPGIATPPPQQYSSQRHYPTQNQQPAQGAPVGQQRPDAPPAGPWEIGS